MRISQGTIKLLTWATMLPLAGVLYCLWDVRIGFSETLDVIFGFAVYVAMFFWIFSYGPIETFWIRVFREKEISSED